MYYLEKLKQFKEYNFTSFKKDISSSIIVALVALPLAMSFAIAIGVKPEYGLYAAIFGGITASLFGGSEYNVTGPTGAFIAILSESILKFGYEKLIIAGLMAGIILLIGGILKFGKIIRFFPYPVIIGFTSGIAIIIFFGQLTNILGLDMIKKHEYFHENIIEIINNLSLINYNCLLITLITILIIILIPKIKSKIPSPLIAVIIATLITQLFNLDIPTILSTFGEIPHEIPKIKTFSISFFEIKELLPLALTIAMLGAIESLLSCSILDNMTEKEHDSNKELIGQGLANILSSLFGGIPVTGAIARSSINVKSGAKTRLSAFFHSIFILLIIVLLAPIVSHIPLASLAGILVVVSFNMAGIKDVKDLINSKDNYEIIVFITTFLLTIFIDLTISISVGILLSALLFIKHMSQTKAVKSYLDCSCKERYFSDKNNGKTCPHIGIHTIEGPLFFGNAYQILTSLINIEPSKALILRMKYVTTIDKTGLKTLIKIINIHKKEKNIYLSGMKKEIYTKLEKMNFFLSFKKKNIFKHSKDAINQALKDQNFEKSCSCGTYNIYE